MNKKEKIKFFKQVIEKKYPDAKTDLEYENDFQLLIAVIMSAQTTDKQVNLANKIFFKILKNPKDGVILGEEKIRENIKTIGFFNNKAKNILKTCEILSKKSLTEFNTIEKLTGLPGVGIKTAKVFLSVVYDEAFLAVDTHVHRVLNRVGIVKTKTPLQTDKEVSKKLSKKDIYGIHNSLILYGRYICKARSPECLNCNMTKICNYYKKLGS